MLAPAMNLERDGAAMVHGYLDEEALPRIVDIIEIAFAYLVSAKGIRRFATFGIRSVSLRCRA